MRLICLPILGVSAIEQSQAEDLFVASADSLDTNASSDDVCDDHHNKKSAFGLCNAFCQSTKCNEALSFHAKCTSCNVIKKNFKKLTGESKLPCEQIGETDDAPTQSPISNPTAAPTLFPISFLFSNPATFSNFLSYCCTNSAFANCHTVDSHLQSDQCSHPFTHSRVSFQDMPLLDNKRNQNHNTLNGKHCQFNGPTPYPHHVC